MTFDQWWGTLTIKEQTVIGKNNAKFVWQQACETVATMIEDAPSLVSFVKNEQNGCLICGFTPKIASASIRALAKS